MSVQNGIVPLLWHFSNTQGWVWTYILALPEVVAAAYLAMRLLDGALAPQGLARWSVPAIIFAASGCFIAIVVHTDATTLSRVLYARGLAVPLLFAGMGYAYANGSAHRLRALLALVSIISTIGAALVLIDHFFVPIQFWDNIGLGAYWIEVKHWPAATVYSGLPGNMFEGYGGQVIRRAIGLYGDPLAAGYSMAIGFGALVALSVERVHRGKRTGWLWLWMALIGAAILVTYTRTAYAMVVLALLSALALDRVWRRRIPKLGILAGVLAGIAAVGTVIVATIHGQNGSVLIHLAAFKTILPGLGHPVGIGYSGTPEGTYTSVLWVDGPIVLGLLLVFLNAVRPRGSGPYSVGARAIFVALLVSGLASAEMFTDTACGAGWVIIGACLSWEATQRTLNRLDLANKVLDGHLTSGDSLRAQGEERGRALAREHVLYREGHGV